MSLDLARKKLELTRVKAARQEQEFKILEREDEINRLKDMISKQLEAENKLTAEIATLEGK